jgi:probable HAF family extracellular repeat protein
MLSYAWAETTPDSRRKGLSAPWPRRLPRRRHGMVVLASCVFALVLSSAAGAVRPFGKPLATSSRGGSVGPFPRVVQNGRTFQSQTRGTLLAQHRRALASGLDYTVTPIAGPVSVGFIASPGAINTVGHAVASIENSISTGWMGFVYDGASTKHACSLDHAFAISSADKVFGTAPYKIKGKNVEDYSTCQGTQQTDLGVSTPQLNAKSGNDNGDMVGFKYVTNNIEHAALWKSGGSVQDLGTLGGTNAEANAINGSRIVVGGSDTSAGPTHAFRYNTALDSGLVDLGVPQSWNWSTARDINNVGDIVGTAGATTCCLRHAYVWQRGSQPFDLGTLLALPAGGALAINNLGEVVGQYWDGASIVDDGSSTGFLYVDGEMYDLNALIPATSSVHIFAPFDINDKGQILAEAYDASKQWYWVVLTPQTAPTPATPVNTSPPEISGLPISGDTLSSTLGGWGGFPATYAIQWIRCSASASNCVDIPGATNGSYGVGSSDVGFTLRVRVTATDEYGSTSAQSVATVVIDTPLNGFRPELRYDSQETYRADAASELTDNCWLDSNSNTHMNSLYDSSGSSSLQPAAVSLASATSALPTRASSKRPATTASANIQLKPTTSCACT